MSEEVRDLLRSCVSAMNEKLACDMGWNILGWEERFQDAYRNGYNYERKLLQEECDKILTFVAEEPLIYDGENVCPFCGSNNVKQLSHGSTLVGGDPDPNHHWKGSECQGCHKTYCLEHKDGYAWYTIKEKIGDDDFVSKVLKGLPTCFESYILTCKKCGGPVLREWRELDGVTPKQSAGCSYQISAGGKWTAKQRCFLTCTGCKSEMEYESEHWTKHRFIEKETKNEN